MPCHLLTEPNICRVVVSTLPSTTSSTSASGGAQSGTAMTDIGPIKATTPMWRCSRIMHIQRDMHPTVLSALEGIVDQVHIAHQLLLALVRELDVVNSHLVADPTLRKPGFYLPRQQWSLLNCFPYCTGQGPFNTPFKCIQGHHRRYINAVLSLSYSWDIVGAYRKRWRLTDS